MADTAHTPTPWKVADEYIYDNHRNEIATTTTSGLSFEEDEANAAHIVKCVNAHDELVNALATLLKLNDDSGPFGGELYQDRVDRAWEKARSVVAKARGETHA